MNIEFTIIYYDAKCQEHQIRKVKVPSYVPDVAEGTSMLWDICFVQDFVAVETNVLTSEALKSSDQYLSLYHKFQVFMKNRKS
jgi:hypothetical protein